jgi:hypothetical protein
MKTHFLGAVCASALGAVLLCGSDQSAAASFVNSNFTMMDATGVTFGGTNDVVASWDGTLNTAVSDTNFNMDLGSSFPFFGFPWSAHHIRVFGSGSYTFDSSCTVSQIEAGTAACGGGQTLDLTVGAGQLGAHMLFDWNLVENIDIALLWDIDGIFTSAQGGELYQGPAGPTPALDTVYSLVSRDVDGDGIAGARMVDGAFEGFSANFNLRPVPLPAAVWLFASGLIGFIGIARRKKAI